MLLYNEPFWDDDRDMFGLLNEAETRDSLDPDQYAKRRGRFYLIWNASKISGRPMLVALMAGNAAHDAETTDTTALLAEVNERFRRVFTKKPIPAPLEVIVTRWKRDPFTRGTYSYVGPETRPGDYDLIAEPVGNLHFAGEATCGTHPATVHGAFLSGLRVASEIMESMAGPIQLPMPLVGSSPAKPEFPMQYPLPAPTQPAPIQPAASLGSLNVPLNTTMIPVLEAGAAALLPPSVVSEPIVKQEPGTIILSTAPPVAPLLAAAPLCRKSAGPPKQSVCSGDPSFWAQPAFEGDDLDYEAAIIGTILSKIGDRPTKPARPGVNPFLLFTKDKWDECKAYCSSDTNPAGRDALRATLGKWWKAASEESKQPYMLQSQSAQILADAERKEWKAKADSWDADARQIRLEFMHDHPPPRNVSKGSVTDSVGVSKRKTNVSNCVLLDHAL